MGYGIASKGDVLVNKLKDGTDLNTVWKTIGEVLAVWNDARASVARLLSYPTVNAADPVPQKLNAVSFERASEFGVPMSVAPEKDVLKLGYTLEPWDLRYGFSWMYLRDANIGQVNSVINDILAADSKRVNGSVIKRILNPAPETNDFEHTCYGLWNGDGIVPLPHMGMTFDPTTPITWHRVQRRLTRWTSKMPSPTSFTTGTATSPARGL